MLARISALGVSCFIILSSNLLISAYAQQDFGIRKGFGIPTIDVIVVLSIIIALFGAIIAFVKNRSQRVIAGSIVIISSFLIIAMLNPVYMESFYAGSNHDYCLENSCSDNKVISISSYSELYAKSPTLSQAMSAARSEGVNNCCAVITMNYFEELSLYPLLASTVKLGTNYSSDNAYLLRFMDEYYTVSFHHLDNDFNYTYHGTMFTIDAVFVVMLSATVLFSTILARKEPDGAVPASIAPNSLMAAIEWLAKRRRSIPAIAISAYIASFIISLSLGSDYHQTSYDIMVKIIVFLTVYIAVITACRFAYSKVTTKVGGYHDA